MPADSGNDRPGAIRIVIADDQAIIREGLTTILSDMAGVSVVGLAANGDEVLALVEREAVDVVLMDLQMPSMDGREATRRLASSHPGVAVVVLTTYTDDDSIVEALRAGALGYLTKNATAKDIHLGLQAAVAGQAILDRDVQARLLDRTRGDPDPARTSTLPDGLSTREGEVLGLVAEGLSNSEIAERLFVSRVTVKSHINQILRKTSCRDRPQVILYALRHQIGAPPPP